MVPEWTGRDARAITPAEVVALLDKITDRGSPVIANRSPPYSRSCSASGYTAQSLKIAP